MGRSDRPDPLSSLLLLTAALAGCRPARSPSDERLRVWSMWGGEEENVFARLLAHYNTLHHGPPLTNLGSVDDTKSVRAIVAGAPPDLITLRDPAYLGVVAANDAVMPLDDLFREAGLREEDYVHGSLSQCRYNGKLYAIPYLIDCIVLLYNKKVFREAGLDPNRPPRTMEELEEICRRLTLRGPDGRLKRIGLRPFDAVYLLALYGGPFFEPQTGRITADHPRHVEAIAMYKRLMDAQGGNEAVSAFAAGFANEQGSYNSFYLGQAAMTFNGQWNAYWAYRYKTGCDFGVAPLPYPAKYPERIGSAFLGGNLFSIPRGARRVKEAWEFLRWTQTADAQKRFAKTMNGVPNIRASLKEPTLRHDEPWRPTYARFMDLADSPNATHFPPMPVASLYINEITNAADAVRYGRTSPEAALAGVRERVQREMDKYR